MTSPRDAERTNASATLIAWTMGPPDHTRVACTDNVSNSEASRCEPNGTPKPWPADVKALCAARTSVTATISSRATLVNVYATTRCRQCGAQQ